MKNELSAGGVVYRFDGDRLLCLFIQDRFGRWSWPKGHLEPGEGPEEAALREVLEETGIVGRIRGRLPATHYYYRDATQLVKKTVHYFLIEAVGGEVRPQLEEVSDARWFAEGQWDGLEQYENNHAVMRQAMSLLAAKRQAGGRAL